MNAWSGAEAETSRTAAPIARPFDEDPESAIRPFRIDRVQRAVSGGNPASVKRFIGQGPQSVGRALGSVGWARHRFNAASRFAQDEQPPGL